MDLSAVVRRLSTGAKWNEMPVINTFLATITDPFAGRAEKDRDA
jgi:hypothetical protein